jgi:hypothetical protein
MTGTEFIGIAWRRSSYSSSAGGNCVEVADLTRQVAVRDSKDPDGPQLTFARDEWRAFSRDIRSGKHDL